MEVSPEVSAVSDRSLLALFHGQQANQWMRNILDGFERSLAAAGIEAGAQRPPAICFLDLTGYTRMTDERGDEAAADLAAQLARLVQRTSSRHGGKPVKWLGDGVMFHFPRPAAGVLAALEMVAGASEAGLPPAHVGLHAGPVLFQGGDYFGRTVNVAARIADYARQGEVLVSQEVVDASGEGETRGRLHVDRPGRAQGPRGADPPLHGAPGRLTGRSRRPSHMRRCDALGHQQQDDGQQHRRCEPAHDARAPRPRR